MGSRSLKGGKLGDAVVGMEELWERIIVSKCQVVISQCQVVLSQCQVVVSKCLVVVAV